ncbi:hypothetical protein HDZ31DRAFT_41018 [Schizophyllum fasciatum]
MHPSHPTYFASQHQQAPGPRNPPSRGQRAYSGYTALSPDRDDLIDNSAQGESYNHHSPQTPPSSSQFPHHPYGSMRGLYDVDTRPIAAAPYTTSGAYISEPSVPAGIAVPEALNMALGHYSINPYAPVTPGDFLPSPISPFMPSSPSTPYDLYASCSTHPFPSPSTYDPPRQAQYLHGMPATPPYHDPGSPSALSSDSSSAVHSSPEQRHTEARHACEHCSRTFTRQHDRRRHVESVHKNHTVECEKCHRTFTRLDSCQRHTDSGNCTPVPRRVRKRT